MQQFTQVTSKAILLLENNIDTDQIIPARYLKGTQKSGLGQNLFANWRFDEEGGLNPECVLNLPSASGAEILLAGDNFGCGSSREHAVWALMDFGIQVVVSTSFADIFRNNSLRNGLLTVQVSEDEADMLVEAVTTQPGTQFTADLETQTLSFTWQGELQQVHFPIDAFAKSCLLQGTDELGYLLNLEEQIRSYEQQHAIPAAGAR